MKGSFWLYNIFLFSSEEALEEIKSRRPSISPNFGFLQQLKLYEKMNFKIDFKYQPWALYNLSTFHHKINSSDFFLEQQDFFNEVASNQG